MALWYSGTDADLIIQAVDEEFNPIKLDETDILAYGVILYQADGTEIARYSSNGTALGAPWEVDAKIELDDPDEGLILIHSDKETTQGLATQYVTARILIQRDATLHGDDHHVDNETWSAAESEVIQINGSKDDSVINMI